MRIRGHRARSTRVELPKSPLQHPGEMPSYIAAAQAADSPDPSSSARRCATIRMRTERECGTGADSPASGIMTSSFDSVSHVKLLLGAARGRRRHLGPIKEEAAMVGRPRIHARFRQRDRKARRARGLSRGTTATIGVIVGALVSIGSAFGGAVVGANLSEEGAAKQQTRALRVETYAAYLDANLKYGNAQRDIARSLSEDCLSIALDKKISAACQPDSGLRAALDSAVTSRYIAVRKLDMVADEDVEQIASQIESRNGHRFNPSGVSVAVYFAQAELDRRAGKPTDDRLYAKLSEAMSCTISGRSFVYDTSGKVTGSKACER